MNKTFRSTKVIHNAKLFLFLACNLGAQLIATYRKNSWSYPGPQADSTSFVVSMVYGTYLTQELGCVQSFRQVDFTLGTRALRCTQDLFISGNTRGKLALFYCKMSGMYVISNRVMLFSLLNDIRYCSTLQSDSNRGPLLFFPNELVYAVKVKLRQYCVPCWKNIFPASGYITWVMYTPGIDL